MVQMTILPEGGVKVKIMAEMAGRCAGGLMAGSVDGSWLIVAFEPSEWLICAQGFAARARPAAGNARLEPERQEC